MHFSFIDDDRKSISHCNLLSQRKADQNEKKKMKVRSVLGERPRRFWKT